MHNRLTTSKKIALNYCHQTAPTAKRNIYLLLCLYLPQLQQIFCCTDTDEHTLLMAALGVISFPFPPFLLFLRFIFSCCFLFPQGKEKKARSVSPPSSLFFFPRIFAGTTDTAHAHGIWERNGIVVKYMQQYDIAKPSLILVACSTCVRHHGLCIADGRSKR